ncbi:MAG: DUF2335 domain-containing protein [Burkholderiales bacterium]|nr:DUF2335 domain-containing protein [Burkholderiales bacterium]
MQQEVAFRQGPLPAPDDLAEYDRLLPGAADRIISMAEQEQQHRMECNLLAMHADIQHRDATLAVQDRVAKGAFASDMAGQILGAVIALAALAGGIYTALNGAHPTVSIALVGLPIAAIIKAVRSMQDKKPDDKSS